MGDEHTPEQWQEPSLCAGWTIGEMAVHIVNAAEQTPGNFARGMVSNGFRFNRFMDRATRARAERTDRTLSTGGF